MIPKNFSYSNDNRNDYPKESLKCTSILLSLVTNVLASSNRGFIKSSKEHITYTQILYVCVINVTMKMSPRGNKIIFKFKSGLKYLK